MATRMRELIVNPETLLCLPMEAFGRIIFQNKILLGFHIFIEQCPMVAAKRGGGTTEEGSGLVCRRIPCGGDIRTAPVQG